MSRETEKAMREFMKFLQEHEGEIDMEKLLKDGKFSVPGAIINGDDGRVLSFPGAQTERGKGEMDAYDYLEMAQDTTSQREAIRYAKKALALDPTLLDADVILARSKQDLAAMQKEMVKVLEKGKKQLEAQGTSFVEDAGDFYMIFETRPYIRAYFDYMGILVAQGKMRKAVAAGEEIIRLNENDNMGARHALMPLYAYLEESDKAEALMKKYENEQTAHMLLPLIALYYKLDDEKMAKKYLKMLCANTKGVREAFEAIEDDETDLDEALMAEFYQPFTEQEIYMTYAEGIYLYSAMPDFAHWVLKNCPKKRK